MMKIVVVIKSKNGKFGAAVAGFGILKFRKRVLTTRRDADSMAARLTAEGHTVEIRDFTDSHDSLKG
jgi:hypothetical protein